MESSVFARECHGRGVFQAAYRVVSCRDASLLFLLHILLHEALVEVLEFLDDGGNLLFRGEDGGTKMVSIVLLTKTAPRNGGDPGGLEELKAVEDVRSFAGRLGCLNSLGWEVDPREGVHGTFGEVTGDVGHAVEAIRHGLCTIPEARDNRLTLSDVLGMAGGSSCRSIHHQGHGNLSRSVGGKVDTAEFVHLRHHLGINVAALDVPTTKTTFTETTFGDGLEAHELNLALVRLSKVPNHFLHRHEGTFVLVDIFLVHFIRKKNEAFFVGEEGQLLELVVTETVPRGVPRVDEDQRTRVASSSTLLVDGSLELLHGETPVVVLVDQVTSEGSTEEFDRSTVQRVLRNGDKNTVIAVPEQALQPDPDGNTGPVCDPDVIRVGWVTITLLDVLGDLFTNPRETLGVSVATEPSRSLGHDLLGTGHGVGGVELSHLRVSKDLRRHAERQDLTRP